MLAAACTPSEPNPAGSAAPAVSATPARTTPVPAPNGSSVDNVEPSARPVDTAEVAIDEVAEVGHGVTARIDSVKGLEVRAKTPGEVDGAAVAVTISLFNDGDEAIDVSGAMVTLYGAGDVLGQPTTSDPYQPFGGKIDAGSSARGVYVFLLPDAAQGALDVSVQYEAGTTIARFVDGS